MTVVMGNVANDLKITLKYQSFSGVISMYPMIPGADNLTVRERAPVSFIAQMVLL